MVVKVYISKKIKQILKERFDEILELNNVINFDSLIYYIKNEKSRRSDVIEIKLFKRSKIW